MILFNTSSITAPPEVAGDAGVLVDPTNVREISQAMNRVLSDNKLKEDLIRKGIERARPFTWDNAANQVAELYLKVVNIG